MRVPIQWSGGVNLNADPRAIRDDQVAKATNAFPSLEGLLDKREPVVASRVAISPSYSDGLTKPVTLFVPDPITGYDFILHYIEPGVGEGLMASSLNNDATPLDQQVRAGDVQPYGPYSFTNYRGNVVAVGAGLEGFWHLCRNSGTGAVTWVKVSFEWDTTKAGVVTAQSQALQVKPRVCAVYQGRMVYANFGPGMENWLVWADSDSRTHSNKTDAPLWARIGNDALLDNGTHVELREIQGESIVAMREIMLAGMGAQVTPCLMVLTDRSCVLITGEPSQTTDAAFADPVGYLGTLHAHRNTYECGIAGLDAITSTPYGTFWASREEVWFMNDNTPDPVGFNIRPALSNAPPAWRKWWSMAYANGVLFLSIVTQATSNDLNLATQHWRLDLRNGPPQDATQAKWWGPQDYERLGQWACPNSDEAGLCHSLVTRRGIDDVDVVYSLCKADTTNLPGMFLLTFNQKGGALDLPFLTIPEARHWAPTNPAKADDVIMTGDVVQPTVQATNGRIYVALNDGKTGVSEPIWNPALASVTADGTVNWQEYTGVALSRPITRFAKTLDNDPAVLLNVVCKDMNMGDAAHEKSVKRVDVEAWFGLKARFGLPVRINNGGLMKQMGPVTFGLRQDGDVGAAMDELGGLVLDSNTGVVAKEYEARSLRPSSINGGRYTDITAGYAGAGVVRGRQIQPIMVDGSGFIIDDTNDYLTVCQFVDDFTADNFNQVSIPHGYYVNMNALLTVIVAQLNTLTFNYLDVVGGWAFQDAYVADAYFTTITKAADGAAQKYVSFVFGDMDANNGTVLYLTRARRLLAMLGYDTSSEYTDTMVNTFGGPKPVINGVNVACIGETLTPNPFGNTTRKIIAQQMVTYTQASPLSISGVQIDVVVKSGLPLTGKSR